MTVSTRTHLSGSAGRLRRRFASLRTQLIFWNVIALSLLLGGLGIVCRFVILSYLIQSVDRDLDHGATMFTRPRPHGGERHAPSEPPPGAPPGYYAFTTSPEEEEGDMGAISTPNQKAGSTAAPALAAKGGSAPEAARRTRALSFKYMDQLNPYHPRLFYADGTSEMRAETHPVWDKTALARSLQGETIHETLIVHGEPVRVLSEPGYDHQGKKGVVQNAYNLRDVYRALSGIDTSLLLLLPIGLLGAGWVGVALTNRVLKRVQRMTQAAGRIGAEDFARRLPVSGNDEFSELAETFNGLLGRLETAFQEQKQMLLSQQRFTADASHELKTPLTIIKGRAGLALSRESTDEKSRRTFQEIEATSNTMAQLVQDLLLLARSDEGRMGHESVELLIADVLKSAVSQALQENGAPITLKIEAKDLCITGNEAELIRLFRNLLDNAVRYTPPEGAITVTARALQGNIVVSIADTGKGIAPEHLPHLGERFYRVDASRTRPTGGTGLGLSICKSIVEAHHGTLGFESEPGVGTTVTVTLPEQP